MYTLCYCTVYLLRCEWRAIQAIYDRAQGRYTLYQNAEHLPPPLKSAFPGQSPLGQTPPVNSGAHRVQNLGHTVNRIKTYQNQ